MLTLLSVQTGQLQQELRRGADKAEIYCLAFDARANFLACSSDKGTVHVFKLDGCVLLFQIEIPTTFVLFPSVSADEALAAAGSRTVPAANEGAAAAAPSSLAGGTVPAEEAGPRSTLSGFLGGMKVVLPKYFSSEWSYAQLRIPEMRSLCAFGKSEGTALPPLLGTVLPFPFWIDPHSLLTSLTWIFCFVCSGDC